jgi:hypothetical protein
MGLVMKLSLNSEELLKPERPHMLLALLARAITENAVNLAHLTVRASRAYGA